MTIIAANVYLERPLFQKSPATIFAMNRVILDRSYLENFDLKKLQAEYPDKVEISGDMVKMQGPVHIVPKVHQSTKILNRAFEIGVIAAGTFLLANSYLDMASHIGDTFTERNAGLLSLAFGGIIQLQKRILPHQEGIRFYNWSRNWPFLVSVQPLNTSN